MVQFQFFDNCLSGAQQLEDVMLMFRIIFVAIMALTVSFSSGALATDAKAPSLSFQDKEFTCPMHKLARNQLKDPLLKKGTLGWDFRTRVKDGMNEGVNFCNQYTVVSVYFTGPFQVNFIVNRKTGVVHTLPGSDDGIEFELGSSLFVINPDPVSDIPGVEPPTRLFYQWDIRRETYVLLLEETVSPPAITGSVE